MCTHSDRPINALNGQSNFRLVGHYVLTIKIVIVVVVLIGDAVLIGNSFLYFIIKEFNKMYRFSIYLHVFLAHFINKRRAGLRSINILLRL